MLGRTWSGRGLRSWTSMGLGSLIEGHRIQPWLAIMYYKSVPYDTNPTRPREHWRADCVQALQATGRY